MNVEADVMSFNVETVTAGRITALERFFCGWNQPSREVDVKLMTLGRPRIHIGRE